ncbi:hypothetical protein EJ05DRAFT_541972 [Pseudovirgaria hyperparasitica]|uniref:CYTH domain-containing protein n=1 Tax=Pseudovirgaria hyperparasitica TaxID=470096 RepID=A0A6A6VUL0_9PEZI|nr:uncharacterized protein EJ05DRAFT_541972 [Pseudovirgaria hyperparasitica]KAF2753476.1 hypothetical protein EJ05DRAFT_541972 [Pseudovirgaria hyperparasitica]
MAYLTNGARAMTKRVLEVERKFAATPTSIQTLRNASSPIFKHLAPLGRKTFRDTYFDRENALFGKGVYIRRRNGLWEAKIRAGGDFINSAFEEVAGEEAVKEVIKEKLHVAIEGVSIEDCLEVAADFVTERESWMVHERFRVDVDETDFGCMVGEVELKEDIEDHGQDEEKRMRMDEERRKRMDEDIKAFMKAYPDTFPEGNAVGKLTAYFDWKKREVKLR